MAEAESTHKSSSSKAFKCGQTSGVVSFWSFVEPPSWRNVSQIRSCPQGVKMKSIWKHHLVLLHSLTNSLDLLVHWQKVGFQFPKLVVVSSGRPSCKEFSHLISKTPTLLVRSLTSLMISSMYTYLPYSSLLYFVFLQYNFHHGLGQTLCLQTLLQLMCVFNKQLASKHPQNKWT